MKQLRLGWVGDLPKVTEWRQSRWKPKSQRASLLHLQLLPGFWVFPAGVVVAQQSPSYCPCKCLLSQFLPVSHPPLALASLLTVARTTECSISTRPWPPQLAPRGQRGSGQQKSVLLLLVKETQGVCFPLPLVTKLTKCGSYTRPLMMQGPHQHIKGLGSSEANHK